MIDDILVLKMIFKKNNDELKGILVISYWKLLMIISLEWNFILNFK